MWMALVYCMWPWLAVCKCCFHWLYVYVALIGLLLCRFDQLNVCIIDFL